MENNLLSIGCSVDTQWSNELIKHYSYRKTKQSFFGFDDSTTYSIVHHPKTNVILIRKRDGLKFTTLFAERVSSVDQITKALEEL